jgi:predicted flavoprotein YhiN
MKSQLIIIGGGAAGFFAAINAAATNDEFPLNGKASADIPLKPNARFITRLR